MTNKEQPQQNIESNIDVENLEEKVEAEIKSNKEDAFTKAQQNDIEKETNTFSEPTERYDRPCREGYNLYTIISNIKINDERFTVQKVIEEKTEKLANIEYDRIIKKEFGKPKSITKRNSREYQSGDIDDCKQVVDNIKKVEKTQEQIEFEEKIELLNSDYIGLFKTNFSIDSKANSIIVFALNKDSVYAQLLDIIKNVLGENKQLTLEQIKMGTSSITKLTPSQIKADKDAISLVNEMSLKELKGYVQKHKDLKLRIKERAEERCLELINEGFNLYECQTTPNKVKFLEFARNEEEANYLTCTEERVYNMKKKTIVEDINVCLLKDFTKDCNYTEKSFIKNVINYIVTETMNNDNIQTALFGKKPIEEYSTYVNGIMFMVDIFKKGESNLITEKTKKLFEDSNTLNRIKNILEIKSRTLSVFRNKGDENVK